MTHDILRHGSVEVMLLFRIQEWKLIHARAKDQSGLAGQRLQA